jgi:hypothetical protein
MSRPVARPGQIRYAAAVARSRTPVSYAWALHLEATETDIDDLSPSADQGLDYADALARNAQKRSQNPRVNRLTIEDLAAEYEVPVATIRARIALARRKLFGNLTDAAITKRVQRQQGRQRKKCGHPDCRRFILPPEHGNRRYCPTHGAGDERAKRHRATRRAAITATQGGSAK